MNAVATAMPIEKPQPAAVRKFGGLILRVVVSVGILAWLGSRMDWSHVAEAFRELRWGYWIAAVGLYIVCQLMCCVRWMWHDPSRLAQTRNSFGICLSICHKLAPVNWTAGAYDAN